MMVGEGTHYDKRQTYSLNELQKNPPRPVRFFIHNFIPEGLSIIAGRPKNAKSWMAWNLCLAVSRGGIALGAFEAEKARALYIALEDSAPRVYGRINMLMAIEPPGTKWPEDCLCRMSLFEENGTCSALEALIDETSARFIVIDTFGKYTVGRKRSNDMYKDEYAIMGALQDIAMTRGLAIVLIHHFNKAIEVRSSFDRISGTSAMSGGPDTVIVIEREPQTGTWIKVVSRDFEEAEHQAQFDNKTGLWKVMTEGKGITITKGKRDIMDFMTKKRHPVLIEDVVEALNDKTTSTRNHMWRMEKDGLIKKNEAGFYYLPDTVI